MPVPQKVGRPDVFYFILKKKNVKKIFWEKIQRGIQKN